MRHRRATILILSLLCLTLLMSGCSMINRSQPAAKYSDKVQLYYGSPGNEQLVYEIRTITYNNPSDKYEATLNSLLLGPQNKKLVANIAPGTKVLSITRNDSDLTVDLSQQFLTFAGSVGEIVAVGSIVNTLVQFPEINRVKILVAGQELIGPSGEPRGFMTKLTDNYEPAKNTRSITLYFADQNAVYVRPEIRQIRLAPNISEDELIKTILRELISGPESGTLYRTIPREANVRSVIRQGDLVKVDFSAEIVTKHWGGTTGEAMTINSLVATLTALPDIKRVSLTVEGKPMALQHMIIDQPLTRDDETIKP